VGIKRQADADADAQFDAIENFSPTLKSVLGLVFLIPQGPVAAERKSQPISETERKKRSRTKHLKVLKGVTKNE
jgi:hypothetical protein